MVYYLKPEAFEELNKYGSTKILDKYGDETEAELVVSDNKPHIYNMFGSCESITLVKVEMDEDGDATCYIAENPWSRAQVFHIYQYVKDLPENYICVWEAKR